MRRAVLVCCAGFALLLWAQTGGWRAAAQANETRIVIERPLVNATVGTVVQIGGWAVDPAGPESGIDAVHVYLDAEPGMPRSRFLGQASYGLPRPDVARQLGDARFTNSGFSLLAELPPGVHSVFVYAHSAGTGPQDGWTGSVLSNFEVSLILANPTVVQPGPAAVTDGTYRTGQAYQGGGTCLRYTGAGVCDFNVPYGISSGALCIQWNQRGQCTAHLPQANAILSGATAGGGAGSPPAVQAPLAVPTVSAASAPRPAQPAVRAVQPPLVTSDPSAEEQSPPAGSRPPSALPAAAPPE
jgi:hypothetical protein